MNHQYHVPVFLNEVLEHLAPKSGETFIDGTLGDGGHAEEILERIAPNGVLLGIDLDQGAIDRSRVRLARFGSHFITERGNYRDLATIAEKHGIRAANGILLDLGISSAELDESGRGFSFQKDEPLDMRMGVEGLTAAEIVNSAPKDELARIIRLYGEERYANRIAEEIVRRRRRKRIITTVELVETIREAVPQNYERGRIHPATRTFQALRIAVNDELQGLREALPQAVRSLALGGRIAVISFHSLEDRIVKHFFRDSEELRIVTKKPIRPIQKEIIENPRARSAKLRVAERTQT
ncbi:MAG: 16S rRNA (cytosine(1402)-N(4))-methyltransferase RsmH [Patescibacteria group bacterium]